MAKDVVDFDELYPGRFLKAGEFKGLDVTLTLVKVSLDELEGNKGKQQKGVLSFRETPKQIALNRTNGECIKAMFGRRLADWPGKRITFYAAKINSEFADIAIRVRGSPDLKEPVTFLLQLARKSPRKVTLAVTKAGAARPANGGAQSDPGEEPPAPGEPETDGADIAF